MFKRKLNSSLVAAIDLPRPAPAQTVHNYAPSEAWRIFALWGVGVLSVIIIHQFIRYSVGQLGYKNPDEVIAYFFFGLIGLLIMTAAISLTVIRLVNMNHNFRLQLAEIQAETARSLSLTAAQPRPGESRLTAEDSKFCALLRVVMDEAYRHVYREPGDPQQYLKSEVKPWSRTPNQGRVIPGIAGEVSFAMAGRVRGWLGNEGVINGRDEINLKQFETFAHFEKLLEDRFYTPVQVNTPALLRSEVSIIK